MKKYTPRHNRIMATMVISLIFGIIAALYKLPEATICFVFFMGSIMLWASQSKAEQYTKEYRIKKITDKF